MQENFLLYKTLNSNCINNLSKLEDMQEANECKVDNNFQ